MTKNTDQVVRSRADIEAEYGLLGSGSCLVDRSDRALLEVAGRDRVDWLHNLTTNQVKTLSVGDGNYAFALNVQGRILFDLNVLCRPDHLWVDVDKGFLETATSHFDKYKVMEDVEIRDRSSEFARLCLVGEVTKKTLTDLGIPHVGKMAQLGSTELNWRGAVITVIRHDFCGTFGIEMLVPAGTADEFRRFLVDPSGPVKAVSVSMEAVRIRSIEAGLPWAQHEITNEYLPAETGQLDRAVTFSKGCYLGQEVVERMRSRAVQSRHLVGLRFDADVVPPRGSELTSAEGNTVGQVTSTCDSIAMGGPIGLAYAKTASSDVGTRLKVTTTNRVIEAEVTKLPFAGVGSGF